MAEVSFIDQMKQADLATDAYLGLMGMWPKRIPHKEVISNPSLIEYVTGMNPWETPRTASLAFYDQIKVDIGVDIPADDTPIRRPDSDVEVGEYGESKVRWGLTTTTHWNWGDGFTSIDQVISYDILDHLDLTKANVVESFDYSLDYSEFVQAYYSDLLESPEPTVKDVCGGVFYNTIFMWPLLTFGWELCLELFGGYPEDCRRLLRDFAVLSRKAISAISMLPDHVNYVLFHDDICMTGGPVCSPAWLREFIYPYYEELFALARSNGKRAIFVCDGNIDAVADDVAACGADGFVSEPYTDWKTIARKYQSHMLAGEGDNRILMTGDENAVRTMVDSMVETARMCGGYFMSIGNHIPWNVSPENAMIYFDYSAQVAHR